MESIEIFILTDEWFDANGRNVIRFYGISNEKGAVEIIIDNVKPVFFVERSAKTDFLNVKYERKNVELESFGFHPVDALYFNTQKDLKQAYEALRLRGIATYESDLDPARRFLMERFINSQALISGNCIKKDKLLSFTNPRIKPAIVNPDFSILSLDIETGIGNEVLYSIAVHLRHRDKEERLVFMTGRDDQDDVPSESRNNSFLRLYPDEKSLLNAFLGWFRQADPDIIIGWHVIGFDLMFLEKKCSVLNIPFNLSRGGGGKIVLRQRKMGGYYAYIPGRVVIDGPPAFRAAFYSFEDFKLDTVARELLGTGKTITPEQNKVEEIERQFREDKVSLAEYNLQDALLVSELFNKTGLIDLAVKRAQLSGLLLDRLPMMSAAFDHFLLPRIHRAGLVAPDVGDSLSDDHLSGGYVIEPEPGIYNNVIVLDFKSLYPTIMRTFFIDPYSRLMAEKDTGDNENSVTTPNGYRFSKEKHFLPEFISYLMDLRSEARKQRDKYLAQAIKILMNSFYGVMGSYGCRFFHPDLPNAITGTGQQLLLGSRDFFEKRGYHTVYGDTDSLFVKLKEGEGLNASEEGRRLAGEVNNYWKERLKTEYGVESFLEIEFEKHYSRFILTPARGGEYGAKKRYAGLLTDKGRQEIEFVGMEFVRSDWTRLAKEFQEELYSRIFNSGEINKWLCGFVSDVNRGMYDDKLVYRKRLRKDIGLYTKNVPPHARAAKMINMTSGTIEYVITKRGPVPLELDHSDIDYQHYIDRQLKPIADSVLGFLGESFDDIVTGKQLSFFD